jgi:hypothetical protein
MKRIDHFDGRDVMQGALIHAHPGTSSLLQNAPLIVTELKTTSAPCLLLFRSLHLIEWEEHYLLAISPRLYSE